MDLETVSRALGVTAATLSGWRDTFLAAGEAGLATRPGTGEELESERLKGRLGEALIERDLLCLKVAALEANRPSGLWPDPAARCRRSRQGPEGGGGPPHATGRVGTPAAMSRAVSPVSGKPYGLAAVCRTWGLARSTIYRHRVPAPSIPRRRPGPVGPMPDGDLMVAIRAVLAASPFHGEGHRKAWARLRHGGTRTSQRRVLRLMREHGLLASARTGSPRGPRTHDGTIIPETIDTMSGTDLTTTLTREGQVAVCVAVDHHRQRR